MQAEVRCAGISYFTREKILDANGNPRKNPDGTDIESDIRREAAMGQIVELSEAEYDRLVQLGAVQEPGSRPLPGSPGAPTYATPFGVPVMTEDGPVAYEGPIMGDPRPGTLHASGLTPEQAAELERRARGADDPEETDADADTPPATGFDVAAATPEEIREHIDSNKLNADQTVGLAGDSPGLGEKVLEAEYGRDKPREGVVSRLEKLVDGDAD